MKAVEPLTAETRWPVAWDIPDFDAENGHKLRGCQTGSGIIGRLA